MSKPHGVELKAKATSFSSQDHNHVRPVAQLVHPHDYITRTRAVYLQQPSAAFQSTSPCHWRLNIPMWRKSTLCGMIMPYIITLRCACWLHVLIIVFLNIMALGMKCCLVCSCLFIYFTFVLGPAIISSAFLWHCSCNARQWSVCSELHVSFFTSFTKWHKQTTICSLHLWINYSDNQLGLSKKKNQPNFNYLFGFILFDYLVCLFIGFYSLTSYKEETGLLNVIPLAVIHCFHSYNNN